MDAAAAWRGCHLKRLQRTLKISDIAKKHRFHYKRACAREKHWTEQNRHWALELGAGLAANRPRGKNGVSGNIGGGKRARVARLAIARRDGIKAISVEPPSPRDS